MASNHRDSLWLVTGAAGFIGSNIAEALVRRGERVRVIDNFSTGKRGHVRDFIGKVELVEADTRDLGAVRRAVSGATHVIHQAALRSVPKSVDVPTETNEINVAGTLNVLIAAKEAKVRRVVYASSSSVYGDSKKFPQREEHLPAPISPYAASKLAAEHYSVLFTKTYGLETVSLRYFNVFGPRQDPESLYSAVIPRFMEQALNGEPLTVHWDGRQQRDFTYVDNVVQANLLAATRPGVAGGYFNIANGRTNSLLDLIRILEKLVGRKLERVHSPKRAGDVRKTWADIGRAKRALGYKPTVGFEDGVRKTWEFFSQEFAKAPAGAAQAR